MYSRLILLLVLAFWSSGPVFAQSCTLSIQGQVRDADTGLPLADANIYVEGKPQGAVSDEQGQFELSTLCPGHVHLVVSHIGCTPQRFFLDLAKDTILTIVLDHSSTILGGAVVSAKVLPNSTQSTSALNDQQIADNANQSLSNLLTAVSGVNTLKNGTGIAKPVVHGLYGNRLAIINNGITQSGQQWGNDHSPEIDPLVANKIQVIKGVGAVAYAGANLGSVILVEPEKVAREPHLHARVRYFFETNGNAHGLHTQMQRYSPGISWKWSGTAKLAGDRQSANYFLNNTGSRELNTALQLEKSFSEHVMVDAYFSSFNTELGILRGGHIGNLTDLETAFARAEPFYTEPNFSYALEAPKQRVNHQLLKLHSTILLGENQWLDFSLAGQLNARKEFDVRRSGRTDIPALSLRQWTYSLEGLYQQKWGSGLQLKTGLQFQHIDNTNDPETGILPLIPDYFANEAGLFALLTKRTGKWLLEGGGRYDLVLQDVVTITQTSPRSLERYSNMFHNASATAGVRFQTLRDLSLRYNIGFATRNPAINELYSGGLHQGVSGIELGDPALKTEHSIKNSLGVNGNLNNKLSFESLLYYQLIDNYILLVPQDEIQLTIRGAFPVFRYEQTQAQIYGLDLVAFFQVAPPLSLRGMYSHIRGRDLTNDIPLINIPSNVLTGSVTIVIPKLKKLENLELEISNRYVFEQTNLLAEQDFVAPPPGYNLVSLQWTADWQLTKTRLRLIAQIDNLFNVAYRDYLNRQRYFADDMGRSIRIGVGAEF